MGAGAPRQLRADIPFHALPFPTIRWCLGCHDIQIARHTSDGRANTADGLCCWGCLKSIKNVKHAVKLFLIIQHSPTLANSRAPPHPSIKIPEPNAGCVLGNKCRSSRTAMAPATEIRWVMAQSKVTEIRWVMAQSPRGGLQSKGNCQGGPKGNGLKMASVEILEWPTR